MKRLGYILLILLLCIGCFAGCGAEKPKAELTDSTDAIVGGDQSLSELINLKDISMVVENDCTKVAFTFIKGSRSAGIAEGNINAVPQYSVRLLERPRRIALTVPGVDFWDFNKNNDWSQSPLIHSQFIQIPVGEQAFTVYLQLSQEVEYLVQEVENQLVLTIKGKNDTEESSYYVTMNLFDEYEDGLVDESLGFTPSYCSNLADKVIISRPLATQQEAEELKAKADEVIQNVAPSKSSYIQELTGSELPQYSPGATEGSAESKAMIYQDGKGIALPVAMENARYLCSDKNGNMIFARTILPDTTQDVEDVTTDKLWLCEPSGKKTQLNIDSFYNVKQAAYSPDGKYLAILDQAKADSILYVYDLEQGELINVGEEGFGNMTSSFVWNPSSNVIYAMTGYESLQLMKYDLNAEEEKITAIEEAAGVFSDLGIAANQLYFADPSAGENGMIYSVDITSGERKEVCAGINVRISQNGEYAAILELVPTEEEVQIVNIKLLSIKTGNFTTVLENVVLEEYLFAGTEDQLYLIYDAAEDQVVNGFPYLLAAYDPAAGQLEQVGNIGTTSVENITYGNGLMLIDFTSEEQSQFQVTYQYNFD